MSVLLNEANAVYIYGGCAGTLNLSLVEDDWMIWPRANRICKDTAD